MPNQNCHIWVFLDKIFKKLLSYLKPAPPQICLFLTFFEKQSSVNLAPKTPYLCTFGQELKQNSCHIMNQHPQICLIAKFHKKNKNA